MKAWRESFDTKQSNRIRFLADPTGAFTRALDTEFDSAKVFGQNRSKRYAITIENGRVKDVFIEPDNTGVVGKLPYSSSPLSTLLHYMNHINEICHPVSAAEKVLG